MNKYFQILTVLNVGLLLTYESARFWNVFRDISQVVGFRGFALSLNRSGRRFS